MKTSTPVVSDAGPLMVLAKLNLLHLLEGLYGRVHYSSSVYNETVVEGMRQGYDDARTLSLFLDQMNWGPDEIDPTQIPAQLRHAHLDRGERDTLALAVASGSTLVLMDDTAGRHVARALGLTACGSLGLLIEAYRRDLIGADQLRLYFAEIASRQDIWINPTLVERLSREVLGD